VFGVYCAIGGSSGLRQVKMLGVESDDLAGYLGGLDAIKRDLIWQIQVMTDDMDIKTWLGNLVKYMEDNTTEKRAYTTFLQWANPTEATPTTIGSGISSTSNVEGAEETLLVSASKLNLGAAIVSAGYDPEDIDDSDGFFVVMTGGGLTDEQASWRYLVHSVDVETNSLETVTSFDEGENEDGYYHDGAPPVVTNATLTLYVRGAAITSVDDKGTALQAISDSFACRKVCVAPCDGGDLTFREATTRVANYYVAAAAAGYAQVHNLEFGYSGFAIPLFTKVYGTDDTYYDIPGIKKLMFWVNNDAGTGIKFGSDFTTDDSDTRNHRCSVVHALDCHAFRLRVAFADWQKMNTSERGRLNLFAQAEAAGKACVDNRELEKSEVQGIRTSGANIDAVYVYVKDTPYIPIGEIYAIIQVA
jgi:hypothetical protein